MEATLQIGGTMVVMVGLHGGAETAITPTGGTTMGLIRGVITVDGGAEAMAQDGGTQTAVIGGEALVDSGQIQAKNVLGCLTSVTSAVMPLMHSSLTTMPM